MIEGTVAMRYAIVSDIHANQQAWNAVSKDAQQAIEWTRARMSGVAMRLFAEMDHFLQGDDFIVCHARADEPGLFHYVRTPEDTRPSLEAYDVPLIFAGHTQPRGGL